MATVIDDLKYTPSHEWVRVEGDEAVVGITDFAQEQLTDIVYVDYPNPDGEIAKGAECAVIESCKIAADLYAPISGTIVAVNQGLQDVPGDVNTDPFGKGWMVRIKLSDPSELDALMDAAAYRAHMESESA
ncbi:MAG: glycine cleavage system protein GcvH [Candidatus Hinthialibacter antarcticus]|nr:glycine cleavage system protein GcvH [Candidatus Hinthialibacter antarcticus]